MALITHWTYEEIDKISEQDKALFWGFEQGMQLAKKSGWKASP